MRLNTGVCSRIMKLCSSLLIRYKLGVKGIWAYTSNIIIYINIIYIKHICNCLWVIHHTKRVLISQKQEKTYCVSWSIYLNCHKIIDVITARAHYFCHFMIFITFTSFFRRSFVAQSCCITSTSIILNIQK